MGDWFQTIADLDATAEEAPGLADVVVADLVADGIVSAERTDCSPWAGTACSRGGAAR
nr:hypothetical protein GCM10020063_054900 [Dactylosporangium thailandense]